MFGDPVNRHGGSQVSQYLHERLHEIIEEVDKKDIDDVVEYTKAIGTYCRPLFVCFHLHQV